MFLGGAYFVKYTFRWGRIRRGGGGLFDSGSGGLFEDLPFVDSFIPILTLEDRIFPFFKVSA